MYETTDLPLLPLNRDIHDIALAVHEEEGEVGGFEWIGEALKGREAVYILPVEFRHHITRLKAGCFCEATFLNIGHDSPREKCRQLRSNPICLAEKTRIERERDTAFPADLLEVWVERIQNIIPFVLDHD